MHIVDCVTLFTLGGLFWEQVNFFMEAIQHSILLCDSIMQQQQKKLNQSQQ